MEINFVNKSGPDIASFGPVRWLKQYSAMLLIFFCFGFSAQAQNKTVTGAVTDSQGDELVGVNVAVVGNENTMATITDVQGNYSIQIPAKGAILKFSYMGYKTRMENVGGNQTVVNVTLEEDAIALDETVVVAMDMRRDEKSLATAYQKLDTKGLTETRDANFLNMLSGKIAGLEVISNGSAGSASVVIRGMNSISGNNQPLYVIDGVVIHNNVAAAGSEVSIDYGNPASLINPDDIESLVVLKGANASALYGSEAANGAIIITTKRAQTKKGLGITFSSNLQLSFLSQHPIYQNYYGSGEGGDGLKKEGFNYIRNGQMVYDPDLPYGTARLGVQNQRSWGLPMVGFDVQGRNGKMKQYAPANTLLDLYDTSHAWTNSISVEKAAELLSVRFSYTNLTSDDVMMNQNKMNRNSMNLRAELKASKYLRFEFNGRYTNEKVDNRNHRNGGKENPLYSAAWMPRDLSIAEMTPWKTATGHLAGYNGGGFVNPMWTLNEISNQDKKDWFLADLAVNFQLMQGLRLRLKAALDNNTGQGWQFMNMYHADIEQGDGKYSEFSETYRNTTYEAVLFYDKRWKNVNLQANIGTSSNDNVFKKQNSEVRSLLMPDWKSLANNAATPNSWQDYNAKKKQAVFGTSSVGFKDFIYLDLTARNDWTSSLPANARSYFYYSVGTSFILTEAIKSIPRNILSFAKLRTSYAKVGNDAGFDQLRNGLAYRALLLGNMPWYENDNRRMNPNLKPETTTSYEVGADLKFWNNRIWLDFTYYDKTSKDQLIAANLSKVSGYNDAWFNTGKVRNWGMELALGVTPVRTKNFEWNALFNWAKNNSEVLELSGEMDRMQLQQSEGTVQYWIEKGHSLGTLYGNAVRRDEQGHILVDREGRPLWDRDKFIADVSPDFIGGFRNSFRYKGFSASILFDFKKGGKMWSATAHQGSRDGQTLSSLEGRDDYLFSQLILGESGEERRGYLQTDRTVNPDATHDPLQTTGVLVPYEDSDRPKGMLASNAVYDPTVAMLAGQRNTAWLNPASYWMNTDANAHNYLYDTSFIKLREVSFGYEVPRSFLKEKLGDFLQTVKISLVGRNLAFLYQGTPKGIDPEASSTLGVIRGLEKGFSLPTASCGFDINVTF